ncbi:hypothetical protein CFN78_09240 [Amycolatopsis antarctica]|uniref:Uncharacterized protein n=1 Tax=Amycolatopsis antarctica TaxID=1854586 RepID=A0A263D5B5_9PSEU|nr:hypothetical protein [Amycolatopsis antarctica]OZM73692.1 hypothetical protein CFN78_09240 [Amycolatopsis antarctica]
MPFPGPDTRVVELRVPGLIGSGGESGGGSLLDSVTTVDVAGDGVGRVVRPADRLRRPAPGPVLQALGRSMPRTLEGYLWNGMTSGGAAKATWALLFPFSLANVAFWMLPPVPDASRTARVLGAACRGLLRVAALLLTMLLISQLAVISLDLLAAQCLAPGAACLPDAPSWLRETDWVRTTIGILPLLLVISVLYRVSGADWPVHAEDPPGDHSARLPGDGLRARADVPALRCLHAVVALACVALLPLGGPFQVPDGAFGVVAWSVALGLLAVSLVAALANDAGGPAVLGAWPRRILLTLSVALVVAVAVDRTPLPVARPATRPLAGADGTVEGIGATLLVVCVLFAVLLVPAALLARPSWRALPRRLRPWAGGWAAAPALALAGLLGGGFGAGLGIAARKLIGTDELRLPASYELMAILWGAGLLFAVLQALYMFGVAVPLRRLRRGVPDVVKLMQPGAGDRREAAAAWARSSWERRNLHRFAITQAMAMSAGALALVVVRLGLGELPSWLDQLSTVGVLALGALAAGLVRVIYTAATGPERSRHLGALADLVCFWPRAAHPTVPPCYALKVVPELAARTKEHLAEPNTRVVLAGYHIGGLLAVVTAARLMATLPERDRERVGVLTAGSPLQWGYERAFPSVLGHRSLAELHGLLGGRWRGLCRGTDTFGGGATTWRHEVVDGRLHGVGYLPDGTVGPVRPAAEGPAGALVLGGDHWLPDPIRGPTPGHRWAAGVLKHADYLADPEWDRAVAMAAGLLRPGRPATPSAEQVPLFPDLSALSRSPAVQHPEPHN